MELHPTSQLHLEAGIGRKVLVCGAVTGAMLAINLRYGRMRLDEDREKAYALALDFCRKFERSLEAPSAMSCLDIIF